MNNQNGFVQLIIILILLIIILSLLGVSLSSLFNDKTLRENFSFVWNGLIHVWDTYLAGYATAFWNFLKTTLRIGASK